MFASAVILFGDNLRMSQTITSNAIVNCMMWAVPCFVMTTGALLLDETKEVSFGKIFKKYLPRILGALIVFGLIFRVFDMIMNAEKMSITVFINAFYKIFTGTSWSHMWYLYLLIGLYVLLPFYRKIAAHSTAIEIKYLLGIYALFLSILPLTQLWNVNTGFYIHVSTIYPFYLLAGYAIHKKIIPVSKWMAVSAVLLSTAGIVIFTFMRWKYNIDIMEQLWRYSSILVIMQSLGIFSLVERIGNAGKWRKLFVEIDNCSFGIYLIHMMGVRLVLRYMGFNPYANHPVVAFTVLVFGIFLISYIITWILKKIPGFRKIL